jgi:predicted amidophosphoribosyltransferase
MSDIPKTSNGSGDMLFCRKCGNKILSDSRFCSKCGAEVIR